MRQSGQEQRAGEEQGEILGPALDHLGEGSVHAGGEGVGGVAEADAVFARLMARARATSSRISRPTTRWPPTAK